MWFVNRSRTLSICSVALFLLALTGCASGPRTFEIKGEADQVINRDVSGNSLSVVIHVYQLKEADEFSKLTFDTLASGRPVTELLGKALLEKNEVTLVPGTSHVSTENLKDEAKFVGVVAFFRRPDPHYWRILADTDSIRKNGLRFRVQDCYLTLAGAKPTPIPGQPEAYTPECAGPRPATAAQPATVPAAKQNTLQQGRKRGTPEIGMQPRPVSF